MWANAQRDGHPAELGCALFSTAQSLAGAHYYTVGYKKEPTYFCL